MTATSPDLVAELLHIGELLVVGLIAIISAWATLKGTVRHLDYKIDQHIDQTREWRIEVAGRLGKIETNILDLFKKGS